jgi:hypothetical protein
MDRERTLKIAHEEMQKHTFDTFVNDAARGGKGVVVSGCPYCKKQMQSLNQFMAHLIDDVLPVIVDRAIEAEKSTGDGRMI